MVESQNLLFTNPISPLSAFSREKPIRFVEVRWEPVRSFADDIDGSGTWRKNERDMGHPVVRGWDSFRVSV